MDYAIAMDRLIPGAKWIRYGSYRELKATWKDTRPIPSDNELKVAFAEWEAEQEAAKSIKSTIRNQASAVTGIPTTALKTDHDAKDALLAILLVQAGAIAPDGTIRPLADWVDIGD